MKTSKIHFDIKTQCPQGPVVKPDEALKVITAQDSAWPCPERALVDFLPSGFPKEGLNWPYPLRSHKNIDEVIL